MRTSDAAYQLWKTRQSSARCKPTLTCLKGKHTVKRDYCVVCTTCHHNHCYRHLLERGIHSIEALIVRQESASSWHRRHGGLNDMPQRDAIGVKEIEKIEDVFKRQAMVTQNYPTCCSLNPQTTQSGWYDTSTPESEVWKFRISNTSSHALFIQAQDSHEKTSDTISTRTTPPREEKRSELPLRRHASLSSLSSVSDEPSTLPTVQDRPRRYVMDHILLNPPAKKRIAPNVDSDSDRPIKRRKTLKATKSRLVDTVVSSIVPHTCRY